MAQLAVTFKASLRINKNLCQKRQAKFYLPFLLEVMFFMGQSFYGMNEHLASSLVVKNKSIQYTPRTHLKNCLHLKNMNPR